MTTPAELRREVKRLHRAWNAAHGRGPRRTSNLVKLWLRRAYEEANRRYFEAIQQEAQKDGYR